MGNLTQQQLESIQVDYGLLFVNYGTPSQQQLGPVRGGGEFNATATIRDIEYDGRMGKTKGMQVIDAIDAMLKVTLMDTRLETLSQFIPGAVLDSGIIKNSLGGLVPASAYLQNMVMFAKTAGGGYKKISIFNAMAENPFTLGAKPKGEGEYALEVYAHWDPTNQTVGGLYNVEDVANLGDDTTAPTVVTVPADAATGVAVGANLTATFNEAIWEGDIAAGNFVLLKAADGSIVSGTLTYSPATKTVTLDPGADLAANTPYIWLITNVRNLAGLKMAPVAVNFTTA